MTKNYVIVHYAGMTGLKCVTDSTEFWIPEDEANTEFQAYLVWLAEGNTAEDVKTDETE